MAPPKGKGIYALGPHLYPDGDPAGYAKRLGCSYVALINGYGVETHMQRGIDLGLRVYLYGTPENWHPDNWADTFSAQLDRVVKLGAAGLIADVEDAPVWLGRQDDVQAVAEALAYAARYVSVGFTSFPSWPYFAQVAAIAAPAGVWGTPQLYGVHDPGTPAAVAARGGSWRQAFGAVRYAPSIAAWSRSPRDQQAYLQAFVHEFSTIMWLSGNTPAEHGPLWTVLRDFRPRGNKPFDGRELLSTATSSFLNPVRIFS